MKAVLVALCLGQIGCASRTIIRDHHYQLASEAYQQQDVPRALERFPEGESGGFITSIEKSWLNLWQGRYDTKPLQKQVATFDERNFTSISREAGYFFTQESEEGYIPAEHEVVILHLISATQFHQVGQDEAAKVELRRASYLLDRIWDDASLRIWLGALWAAMGEWDDAQVDFRRAHQMQPSSILHALGSGRPPQLLELHFYGNGPVTRWNEGAFEPEFLDDRPPISAPPILFSTWPWFKRHTQRNTELRDILIKSNFMAQYLGSKALTGTEYGMAKSLTGGIRAAGIVLGAALLGAVIYVAAQSNMPGDSIAYLGGGAIALGAGVYNEGAKLDKNLSQAIKEDDERKQRDLRTYRMVRFLPTWIGLTSEPFSDPPTTLELRPVGKTQLRLVNHY